MKLGKNTETKPILSDVKNKIVLVFVLLMARSI